MAKLPRIFQKIFGSTAPSTDIGVFGSLAAGSPQTGTNLGNLQSLSQFTDGWKAAILGNNSPAIEDMNALFFMLTSQMAYQFQMGVSEWDATTAYYTGSFVNVGGLLFWSLVDNNAGNPPATSPTYWRLYDSTPSGVILPFGGITTPINYALCDGGLESRTAQAGLFGAMSVSITGTNGVSSNIISGINSTGNLKVGWPISGPNISAGTTITSIDSASQIHISNVTTGANAAGTPFVVAPWGIGDGTTTFNRPDLRGRVIIGAGAGAGLSARTLAALLGEENHILSIAEMPSHNHGGNTGYESNGHTHGYQAGGGEVAVGSVNSGPTHFGGGGFAANTGDVSADHYHAITAQGGGTAHNTIQPSGVANYIIKY